MQGAILKIGELARHTGISTDALRFYEKLGLIRSARTANGYRAYPEQMIELVGYIATAKRLGFTLAEIGSQVPELLADEAPAQALGRLFETKAAMIGQRIGELTALRQELLRRAASACPLLPPSSDDPGATSAEREG